MHAEAQAKLRNARVGLMMDPRLAFFATLMLQLELVETTDKPTMATDGKRILYNPEWVMKQSRDKLIFTLAHETMHVANKHHLRRGHRNPRKWNRATDYVINGPLIDSGLTPPDGVLHEPAFAGLSAEDVCARLPDEPDDGGQGNKPGGQPQPGNGPQQSGNDPSSDPGDCGEVIDGAPAHDAAAIADASAQVDAMVRQAAAIAKAANAGTLPGGIDRMVGKLTEPEVDWRAVLRSFVDDAINTTESWNRLNNRMLAIGHMLPSRVPDGTAHMVVAIDTSGSIDQAALTAFSAEVRAAFDEGTVERLTVIYADTRVQHVDEFEAGDIVTIAAKGGGGTAFSDTFRWIASETPDASVIVYFTDMEVSDFGDDPGIPTMWAVWGDPRKFDKLADRAPFGQAIPINVN